MLWCIAESLRNRVDSVGKEISRSGLFVTPAHPLLNPPQCDKKRESCGQCIRANLVCPGYYDASQIIFRHETESIVRKVQTQRPVISRPSKCLVPCMEDRAKALFISRYVFCKTGRFPYMDHFWISPPHHAHLAACLRAVSLAYLAFEFCSAEILQSAMHQYSFALRLTNNALQNPHMRENNATLLTVLLFYIYEKLTKPLLSGRSDELKHLDGALTLLQLSGASQFNDPTRLQLFRQISMGILLRCLTRGDDIPAKLLSLRESVDDTDGDGQLEGLMMNFAALKFGIRRGDLLGCEVDAQVKELDRALFRICGQSPRWKFSDAIAGNVSVKDLFICLIESTSMLI